MRIILVALPRLIGEMAETIVAERWRVDSIVRLDSREALASRMVATATDLVVCSAGDEPGRWAAELLATNPSIRVLALSADGRSARVYRANREAFLLRDFSPRELVAALCFNCSATGGERPPQRRA